MNALRTRAIAAGLGGCAVLVSAVFVVAYPDASTQAGGSGDSSTTGQYTSPVVPAMSVDPTAMNLGATVTAAVPATTLAVAEASPSVKATPAPGCVNNGQCP
jgi:hypothetical protein